MGTAPEWLIDLSVTPPPAARLVGGKAANLSRLGRAGFNVAPGFCFTVEAYERFVREAKLDELLRMELQRKPLEAMRWEELWDTALRIRSAFVGCSFPITLSETVEHALNRYAAPAGWAVRSSAPGEDSHAASFAGLHESVLPVHGTAAVLNGIRTVWASLWSDAALLYRRELGLDPGESRMAVLLQPVIDGRPSGVAFGCDPRTGDAGRIIVEAVPGRCADLVDGAVDPDHWTLDKRTGATLSQRSGNRNSEGAAGALLLSPAQLDAIRSALSEVEARFGWIPDVEWTWHQDALLLLQARPVTMPPSDPADQRPWYRSLKPSPARLKRLARRVTEQLIPELAAECDRLAAESLDRYPNTELAHAIRARRAAVDRWKDVYRQDFIPFAHGVRQFGVYYNDLVRPDDPFAFVILLGGENFLARQRDDALCGLARRVAERGALADALDQLLRDPGSIDRESFTQRIGRLPGGPAFLDAFDELCREHFDIAHEGVRLAERPEAILHTILERARMPRARSLATEVADRERYFLDAAGPARREEARALLDLARLSWRLRDDDNILIGRLESQWIRAVEAGAERLRRKERLTGTFAFSAELADRVADALQDPSLAVNVPPTVAPPADPGHRATTARQLVGQPAAPGLAAAAARRIRDSADLLQFQAGEVLVCDAVQPTMTHLVPLAAAIVERRGGMLIHGAIIARELGIPCVNGVDRAMQQIRDGDWVTVDGYLGIVTLGHAEFDLEVGRPARRQDG
ncbi:MAG: PEP-utilizing enzyme [Methylotetracoccus sp.]|nr:PEP-utilizing enzyme [Methylotetracoccus sp.]